MLHGGQLTTLLTLAAVIVVRQVENQILQPIVMGRSVELHPLAIAWALVARDSPSRAPAATWSSAASNP